MAASDPTNVPARVPEGAVDELYGVPIDEFTPRRDAVAKELRGAGERDAATWVKGLRRPSAAAWIVNQLARTRAGEASELLRAGDALRAAHERLVGGAGDPDELRAAADAEHEAARGLLANAGGFLDRDGHSPSRATLEKVAETIRAVALDDEARAGFEKGRLTRERSASGFGPLGTAAAPAAARPARGKPAGRGRKAPKSKATERGGRDARAAATAARAARKTLERARAEQGGHARDVKVAERELAAAQREAERAGRRLRRAAADLEEARSREAEAASRVREAEARLDG